MADTVAATEITVRTLIDSLPVPGDYDGDGAVDLGDFGYWDQCMTGPEGGPYDPACAAFDFEFDGDVDVQDFGGFQTAFTG